MLYLKWMSIFPQATLVAANKHIFLVDDDPFFLDELGGKIRSAGFAVSEFNDPQRAVQAAASQKPDLIIIDMQMSRMSGIDMLNQLKSDTATADLKIVFLTAAGTTEQGMEWIDRKFAKDMGAVDYIHRGDTWESILPKIIRALE